MTLLNSVLTRVRTETKTLLQSLFTHGAVGEDTTAPTAADTQLGLEVFRDAIDDTDVSVVDKITSSLRVESTEANGNALAEISIAGTAIEFVDTCDVADWTDSADTNSGLDTDFYKQNGIALDVTKAGTTAGTAFVEKKTTELNFTEKNLNIWVYVSGTARPRLAANNAVGIRFGSGTADYFEWTKDRSDLSIGWNLIKDLTIANAGSSAGTVVLTAMDYTRISFAGTTSLQVWGTADVIIDDIILRSGTTWIRNTFTAFNKTDDINAFFDTTAVITVVEI